MVDGLSSLSAASDGCRFHPASKSASKHMASADDGRHVGRGGDMILGVGTDLIDIRRIEKSIARFGDRFLDRVFTETERRKASARASPAAAFSQRYAAKEACAKALGTGLSGGVFWRDMGVVNLPSGKPTLALTGGAALRLKSLIPEGHKAQIDISITDDFPIAQAIVIISALPA
jgi:holo-[acyl-carrier protein] synthase